MINCWKREFSIAMRLLIGISAVMSVISLPAEGSSRTVTASKEDQGLSVLMTEGDRVTLSCNTDMQWIFCLWDSPQKGTDHKST